MLPYIAYRSERFSLGFDGGSYTVYDDNGQSLQLLIRPRFPLIDDDVPELSGLSRDIGLDVGATLGVETAPGFTVSLTALQGLTDAQQGQEVDLRFSHQLGQLPVSLYAGAAWQSDELTEYLYGVRSDEAVVGRPAYAPGAAITPYIGVQGILPVTDRAAIIGSVEGAATARGRHRQPHRRRQRQHAGDTGCGLQLLNRFPRFLDASGFKVL